MTIDQPVGCVMVKGTVHIKCLWMDTGPTMVHWHLRKYRSTEGSRNELLFVKSYKMILYKNKVCRELWLYNTND
jgi:hypothetical protein